jgi:pimeloyl-ACP methyl ester carboxylesterase
MSLDPFLFDGEPDHRYEFDAYTGEQECADYIDSAGALPDSVIHVLSMRSGSETIAAVYLDTVDSRTPSDTVVLYLHGKSDHIDYYWPRTRLLYATGYPTLAVDYRGFGQSTGETTEEGIYEDGESAMAYLRDSLGDPLVWVYGFSLGSLVACKLAEEDPRGRIVRLTLESPIGSVQTIIADGTYMAFPSSYVSTYTGDNTERIKNIDLPFLWIHGTNDETLAMETHGQRIWDNYRGSEGYKMIVGGGGHGTVPETIGYTTYIEAIQAFIRGEQHALFEQ